MIPKYKVWDTVKKAMSEVQAIVYTEEKVYPIYFKEIRRYIPFSEAILMQSTGLFDNSTPKKEIFEGDVVELHHFTENYSETGGFYEGEESLVGVVRYGYTDDEIKYFGKVYPPRWFIENRYRELVFSDLSGLHEESFKVIGDVYRNPELLEVE